MKRVLPIIIMLAAIFIIVVQKSCTGKVYYAREYESPGFKLRWEVRDGGFTLEHEPFNVVFKSARASSNDWREIMTGWTDEPNATPSDNFLRFIDARSGYVFYCEKYAVTTDAGQSWTIWDATQQLPYRSFRSIFIEDVIVGADGRGQMSLSIPDANPALRKLNTSDHGKSWQEK